jgi:hypothetical protein
MGERGRRKAAEYDWSRVADRVLDYYEETIDAHMVDPGRRASRIAGALRNVKLGAVPWPAL